MSEETKREETKQEETKEKEEAKGTVRTEPVQSEAPQTEQIQAETPQTEPIQFEAPQTPEKPKPNRKKWGIIGAAAAVIIAIAVGVGIYSLPANRLSRQLSLGNKYLEEQNYEEAVVAFEQAIAIDDRCMQAYVGGIEAYLQTDNREGMEKLYEQAVGVIDELDDEFLAENMAAVVDIYLYADDVYSDDLEKAVQILEKGMEKTGDNPEIKEEMVKDYLKLADAAAGGEAYEKALGYYDRLLELDKDNEEVVTGLETCLQSYIDILMEEKRYDEIRQLAEKYQDIAANIDFRSLLEQIAELERIEAENLAFMQKVYDLMEAEDYEAMHEVDGSEEANAFAERMEGDSYIYIPEDGASRNGTGSGVYKFGESGYYFFYGQYVDGERVGNGSSFIRKSESGYQLFTGEWKNDAPNGYGEEILTYGTFGGSGNPYTAETRGNYTDGLCDGEMERIVTSHGINYDLLFKAENGVPTEDKTKEFLNAVPEAEIEENSYVVAYDVVGQYYVCESIGQGRTIGTIGYGVDYED